MTAEPTFPDTGAIDYVSEARGIDYGLRSLARTIANDMQTFKALIDEARAKSIHGLLGFQSWPAYISDVIGKEMKVLPVDDRRQIVGLLAGEGMSQRAIADAVGVSQKTVDRDLDQLSHDDSVVLPDRVTSLDGKERPAHPAKQKPRADVPKPEPKPEPPATPVEDDLHDCPGCGSTHEFNLVTGLSPEKLAEFVAIDERIDAGDERARKHHEERLTPEAREVVLESQAIAIDIGELGARVREMWIANDTLGGGLPDPHYMRLVDAFDRLVDVFFRGRAEVVLIEGQDE